MEKEESGIQLFCNHLGLGEFRPIVRCDGMHPFLVWREHSDNGFRQTLGVLPLRELFHQQVSVFYKQLKNKIFNLKSVGCSRLIRYLSCIFSLAYQ